MQSKEDNSEGDAPADGENTETQPLMTAESEVHSLREEMHYQSITEEPPHKDSIYYQLIPIYMINLIAGVCVGITYIAEPCIYNAAILCIYLGIMNTVSVCTRLILSNDEERHARYFKIILLFIEFLNIFIALAYALILIINKLECPAPVKYYLILYSGIYLLLIFIAIGLVITRRCAKKNAVSPSSM